MEAVPNRNTEPRARVAILGAGAMGTLFAYLLAERNEVTLVDVRGDIVETINSRGGVQVDELPLRPVRATTDPSKAFSTNFLFVFVKAQNTLPAIRPFTGQLNPSTPVVSLQNGLGNEEAIAAALGSHVPLVVGITNVAGLSVGHGHSLRLGVGSTVVGAVGASSATLRSVQVLLQAAMLDVSIVYDIRPHLWGKLIANAAINPIAALLDVRNGVIGDDSNAAELARSIALESAAVARAAKVSLPFSDAWEYVRAIISASGDQRNSMTVDLNARMKTEIDHINGAIVVAGRRYGVATPFNEAVTRMVKAKESAPRA